jgi:poly-gamma-glutamate capsule biosynthesis protein CapA/YwtB (metallophosphatase superfamily)
MANQSVSLYAVGDIHTDRPNPDEAFDLARPILNKADITFGQLEGVCTDRGVLMPQLAKSVSLMDPGSCASFKNAGFTIMSCAGNHSMDYTNFLDTIDHLKKNGITGIGLGKDIDEARKPVIVDVKGTRIGFLAINAIENLPNFHAGIGKPGTAPLKVHTTFEWIDHQPGIPPISYTKANEKDVNDIIEDIKKLRPQVDVLVWSCHWGLHMMPKVLADYETKLAHDVIDAGADLILGHHPHIMKGIEIYKDKAIFYSMGNFVFDIYSLVSRKTLEKYDPHNVPAEMIGKKRVPQALLGRSYDPDYPRYQWPVLSRKTMIVKCSIADKKIEKVTLVPAWINGKGQPEPVSAKTQKGKEIIEFLVDSSEQFRTKLPIEGDEAVVV